MNLSEKLPVRFQQENDTPDLPGPYGVGGWTANDASVLLYDEFDIWEVRPDGSGARNVTGGDGRKSGVVVPLPLLRSRGARRPAGKPLFLSATDDRTRATGFYSMPNLASTAAPEKVVMLDKAFGAVTKARQRRHRGVHALAVSKSSRTSGSATSPSRT